MEILNVENRFLSILNKEAERFSELGLNARVEIAYFDKAGNEYREFNKNAYSLMATLCIGTPDMAEDDMLFNYLTAEFKPCGEKIIYLPDEDDIKALKDELDMIYERLSSAGSVEEEIKKINDEIREKAEKMLDELNKKTKHSFIFLGVCVGILLLIFTLTLLV